MERAAFDEPLASPETPRREYDWIPADSPARASFRVERDVLITPDPQQPETMFYRVGGLGVDAQHNIYVLDFGDGDIKVFDRTGTYVRSVGEGRGQGPGQLGQGGRIAVADDRIYYVSGIDRRLVIWDLAGKELSTRSMRYHMHDIRATDERLLIASWRNPPNFPYTYQVGNLWNGGGVAPLISLAPYPRPVVVRGTRVHALNGVPIPMNEFALGADRVYVTRGDRYEVLGLDLETREEAWVLGVEGYPTLEFGASDREAVLAGEREDFGNIDDDEVDWPSHYPSLRVLAPLSVDGRGRLWVFPFVKEPARGAAYPVDVYDSDGMRVAVGLMPRFSWLATRDDFIYGVEVNANEELDVVRYRVTLDDGF